MVLNFISNFAAAQALRFVNINSADAQSSVAKLASGSRVVNAADDVASLAIGTRLAVEVAALETVEINVASASALLQIADGALSTIGDILTRAQQLSVQAGSQNLSDTERALIDTEFQALLEEIDRIAADTEFSGLNLLDRDNGSPANGANLGIESVNGVINVAARQFNTKNVTDGGDGSFTINFTAGSDTNSNVVFSGLAVSANGSITFSATLSSDLIDNAGNTSTADLATGTTLLFAQDVAQGAGFTNLTSFSQGNSEFVLSLDEDFAVNSLFNTGFGTAATFGQGAFNLAESTDGPFTDFTFKVGSGIIPSQDNIEIDLGGVTTNQLGIRGLDVTTFSRADASGVAVSLALDFLIELRAEVGAATNRIESASENLAVTIENTEAARSAFLDLDVAREITIFTNEQILVQAGISVLAQANQLPQNLLRLFI